MACVATCKKCNKFFSVKILLGSYCDSCQSEVIKEFMNKAREEDVKKYGLALIGQNVRN